MWRVYRAIVAVLWWCVDWDGPHRLWALAYRARHAAERACLARTGRTIYGERR